MDGSDADADSVSDADSDPDTALDDRDGEAVVFVYGTLTDPDTADRVLDSHEYRGQAVLEGASRVEGRYPTLVPGGSVAGRLLATDDLAALDRYEGVADGLYVRVSVPLAGEGDPGERGTDEQACGAERPSTVEVYVGDPDRLDAPGAWPGEGTFAERVRTRFGERATVLRRGTFEEFDGYGDDERTDAAADHDDWGVEE